MKEMKSKEDKMNKEEILQEIEKTKKHLSNMQNMLQGYNKRWKPKEGEEFWYIDSSGSVNYTLFMPKTQNDNMRFKNYNCFKTREQAEVEAEKILVRRQLEDIAKRLNKGEEIDWFDGEQPKHCIELFCNTIITNFYFSHRTQGTTYCLDKNFLDVAKREIGEERLKAYLRGK